MAKVAIFAASRCALVRLSPHVVGEWSVAVLRVSLPLVLEPTSIALDALYLALRLSAPVLGVAFAVSLLLALVQLFTQLREPTLNAIPRLLGVSLLLAVSGASLSDDLVGFASRLYRALPELVRAP